MTRGWIGDVDDWRVEVWVGVWMTRGLRVWVGDVDDGRVEGMGKGCR